MLRKIASQSVTGMHRLVSKDKKCQEIVDLSQHCWYFTYGPNEDLVEDEPREVHPSDGNAAAEIRSEDIPEGSMHETFKIPEGPETSTS